MPFEFKQLEIPGPVLIEPGIFLDGRGYFLETYKKSDFVANGIDYEFVQDNHSFSKQGVVRGLHFQLPPVAQGKLVKVVGGKAWDVAVDIRKSSPNYLKWVGVELSDQNHNLFFIPPGFAHGFVVLSEEIHFLYKCTTQYSPEHERGISWDDPQINIQWPVEDPTVSERDKQLPLLKDAETFD